MRGSIQKKGSSYYVVIPLKDGRRKWFRGGSTKKAAEKVLAEKLNEIGNGTYRDLTKATFQKFAGIWIKNAEKTVKPSTMVSYRSIINGQFIPVFGFINMVDISTIMLQNYCTSRLEQVGPKTVINEIVLLKRMFKHADKWNYINDNPAGERPRIVKREIEILNVGEIERLLSVEDFYRTAFLTGILTGLRAGELWGLQWGDIDWQEGQIYVKRSLWRNQFQTPKSKYSIRKVDMPDNLIHELKKWKLSSPVNDYAVIFPSPEGRSTCHDNAVKGHFNRALRKAGLRHVSFHSLRHTNASLRIASGQNIKYIQVQMGHSSIKVTLDVYGHLLNDINFNRQQVYVFETFLETLKSGKYSLPKNSVRNPLENPLQIAKKGSDNFSNPLISFW